MDVETFFTRIDSDLRQYARAFRKLGFTSSQTMKYWREEDFENLDIDVPEGHRRLILNMITKLRTSEIKSQKQTISIGSPEMDCFRSRRDLAISFSDTSKSHVMKSVDMDEPHEEIPPSCKQRKLDISPVDLYIQSKEQELQQKNNEIMQKKTELLEMTDRIKAAFQRGQECSNCHEKNHTVWSCTGDKCESSFLCGDLSKHSDESWLFK